MPTPVLVKLRLLVIIGLEKGHLTPQEAQAIFVALDAVFA
jgi:hypothetical protein